MEGENKETKITSVDQREKERVKDPRRVEQGKKLAAISREAKKRKARDRAQREAEQQRETESFNPYMVIVPAIGIALGGYYLYHLYRPNEKEEHRPEERKEPKKKPNLKKL